MITHRLVVDGDDYALADLTLGELNEISAALGVPLGDLSPSNERCLPMFVAAFKRRVWGEDKAEEYIVSHRFEVENVELWHSVKVWSADEAT